MAYLQLETVFQSQQCSAIKTEKHHSSNDPQDNNICPILTVLNSRSLTSLIIFWLMKLWVFCACRSSCFEYVFISPSMCLKKHSSWHYRLERLSHPLDWDLLCPLRIGICTNVHTTLLIVDFTTTLFFWHVRKYLSIVSLIIFLISGPCSGI